MTKFTGVATLMGLGAETEKTQETTPEGEFALWVQTFSRTAKKQNLYDK